MNKRTRAQKDAEWERSYHSETRVNWVSTQFCLICGATPCDNAHTETGGKARKADYATIVPLCRFHHEELHRIGEETFGFTYDIDLIAEAVKLHKRWLMVQSLGQK